MSQASESSRRSDPTGPIRGRADAEVREAVRQLISRLYTRALGPERRAEPRFPYPYPVHVTPVASDGTTPSGAPLMLIGKTLSETAIDFYHREPLPYRRVIASLETGPRQWLGLLVELTWCRYTSHGWYNNGGRLLRVVRSPLSRQQAPTAAPIMTGDLPSPTAIVV